MALPSQTKQTLEKLFFIREEQRKAEMNKKSQKNNKIDKQTQLYLLSAMAFPQYLFYTT